ncbi:hypothetical protein OGY01_20370 [Citrobacter sp. Cm038]|uniref:hypothetical protein n=1 Tax=Citrobacter sp. Cm038 TaxID=2985117 RepID=UPI002576EFCB|nr:hypothetical protein [Citrobacter sp. Cm038]MDM2944785.1 hypothetical protein [Citrobacter sp. Cm038]
MISKWATLFLAVMFLSGCVGKANHPQCQKLKAEAAGSQFGAAMAGTYLAQAEADMDNARYERCEEMFDLVQYQAQVQAQMQQQAQAEAQSQAQERQKLMVEKSKSPEMQEKLGAASLADLVSCEKEVSNENSKYAPDVKAAMSFACEREVDRRVDSGKVSRAKVDKMLNQGM